MFNLPKLQKKQSGVVLVISLVMLLLLTLIGVTATQVTSLEEKMAHNMRDRNLAFQAAESALREGEAFLTQATLPSFTLAGTNGLYSETATPPRFDDDWSVFSSVNYSGTLGGISTTPEYVIQRLGSGAGGGSSSLDAATFSEAEMYRVTARGVGGTATAVVVVQSHYKR
jgi:type IV pilus assembly protein PilX